MAREAFMIDSSSQGAKAGAFQPAEAAASSKLTCAPYGGTRSSVCLTAFIAVGPSVVGASRRDTFSAISGNNTLPADPTGGSPSAPVIATVARHVLLINNSTGS